MDFETNRGTITCPSMVEINANYEVLAEYLSWMNTSISLHMHNRNHTSATRPRFLHPLKITSLSHHHQNYARTNIPHKLFEISESKFVSL